MADKDIAWCPGCGNYMILASLKQVLKEEGIAQDRLVMVSGIGQAAKTPHYVDTSFFNGLHGRSLPPATAIKAANPGLVVVAESGDGCMYGEGGNHFIHSIRRNPDITVFVHNNMVYALTKGQASPTSQLGYKTPVQTAATGGVHAEPFNPLAVAVALDAPFVARAYSNDQEQTRHIMKAALAHRGFSLVDIFQPCVTFNKVNTARWYKEKTYYVGELSGGESPHDPADREAAMRLALETGRLPLGIIYRNEHRTPFEETLEAYRSDSRPLFDREIDPGVTRSLLDLKRYL